MAVNKPALDPAGVEAISRCGYPQPYRARVMPRHKRRLGDALGLTRIGINLTMLPPGKESSMRHWHTHEDDSCCAPACAPGFPPAPPTPTSSSIAATDRCCTWK